MLLTSEADKQFIDIDLYIILNFCIIMATKKNILLVGKHRAYLNGFYKFITPKQQENISINYKKLTDNHQDIVNNLDDVRMIVIDTDSDRQNALTLANEISKSYGGKTIIALVSKILYSNNRLFYGTKGFSDVIFKNEKMDEIHFRRMLRNYL